jgi:hypothetical protein
LANLRADTIANGSSNSSMRKDSSGAGGYERV